MGELVGVPGITFFQSGIIQVTSVVARIVGPLFFEHEPMGMFGISLTLRMAFVMKHGL